MCASFIYGILIFCFVFFFSSRRRHTRLQGDWSSDVCSSDLERRKNRGWEPRRTLSSRIGMMVSEEMLKVSSVPVYTKTAGRSCGCGKRGKRAAGDCYPGDRE